MKKISISMAKGGVGKTSTAVNLSAALAKSGKRVLLVDCDPQQGNATLFLGHNPNGLKITIANVINALLDLGTPQFIHEAAIHQAENFDLLPANPKLEAIQNRLIAEKSSTIFGGETGIQPHEVLKTILREMEDKYDYAVLDCPPSISMLSINSLVAADSVLLPVEAHYECYEEHEAFGRGKLLISLQFEYYPPWEPPVSRFRATRKWYFPPSEPPQHIVAAHIFDFTINLLIVILGELLMQYHQIIYREVFLCLRRQKSEVFWNFWEKI